MTAPVRPPPEFSRPDDDLPRMPDRIGKYFIQKRLGAGGMAVVYAAMQEAPKRLVALKVMRPGIAASASARRFRRESEILARLRHPHIAQVFDAGMWDDGGGGMPYFVMEYIPDAAQLDSYCDAKKLDLRDRLKLFVKVCAGVQHGHAQGVVHRDLKPGNILVTASGEPKIIDYGVARATESDFAGHTQQTEAGKLVGTVAYMSPEQVEGRQDQIDPRTDVYALGVILYRLLTDRSPYPLGGIGLHEAVRVIREVPATRPSAIRPELKGDLETILLTTLDKDRTRRYADAGALGRDLLRYLAHKPIKARPAGPFYRARLFVRRNRGAVVASTAVAAAVLLLGAGAGWLWLNWQDLQAERTRIATETADRERADREARERAAATIAPAPARQPVILSAGRAPVLSVAPDAAGAHLATLDAKGVLRVWSLAERRVLHETPALEGLSGPLAIMPAGDRVLLGRSDGLVEAMRIADGEFEETPLEGKGEVTALAVSADGRFVASAGADLVVRLWPTAEPRARELRQLDGLVTSLAFHPGARALAAGFEGGFVMVGRDLRPRAESAPSGGAPRAWRQPVASSPVSHLAYGADGSILAAATEDGHVRVVRQGDNDEAALRWNTRAHERELSAMALHPSGETLGTADNLGRIRVWSATGTMEREIQHGATATDGRTTPVAVWALAYSGEWLVVGGDDGRVVLLPVSEAGVPVP